MLNQHKMLICIVWTNTRFNSLVETVIHDSLASRKNLNLNTQGHFWLETQIRNSLNCSTIEKFFLRAQPPCVNLLECYSLIIFKLLSFHGDLMYPRLPSNSAAKATLNSDSPASISQVLEREVRATNLVWLQVGNGSQGFLLVWQVLTQWSYIPSLSLSAALTWKSKYKLNTEDRRK